MVREIIPPDVVEGDKKNNLAERPGTFSEDGFVSGTESPEPPKRKDVVSEEVRNAEEIAQSLAQREEDAEKPRESIAGIVRGFVRDHTTEKIKIKLEGDDVRREIEQGDTFKNRESLVQQQKIEAEKVLSLDTIITNKNAGLRSMDSEISRLTKIIANFEALDGDDLEALAGHSSRFQREKKEWEAKKADLEKTINEAKQEKNKAEEEKNKLNENIEKENAELRKLLATSVDRIHERSGYKELVAAKETIGKNLIELNGKKTEYKKRLEKIRVIALSLPKDDASRKSIEDRIKTMEGSISTVEIEISDAENRQNKTNKNISGIEKRVSSVKNIAVEKGFNNISKPSIQEVRAEDLVQVPPQNIRVEQTSSGNQRRQSETPEKDETLERELDEMIANFRSEVFNKLSKEKDKLTGWILAQATERIGKIRTLLEDNRDGRAFACRDAIVDINKSKNNATLFEQLKIFLNTFN